MRRAFSLVELMISIVILSIMMLFLYKSYSGLNKSNKLFDIEVQKVAKIEKIKNTLYLDIMLSQSVLIQNQDNKEDVVFLQTRNSVHDRFNPYVAYLLKDKKLYRLESLKELREYPLAADSEFVVDELGSVKIFRLYTPREAASKSYLLHILFDDGEEILLKIKSLNSK